MAEALFANNATSTLAGSINNVATSCNLAPGSGTLFPNPTGGDYFIMTFTDSATGLVNEIVHCTARSGDTLTIVRAQEGTTAAAWSAGDLASALVTAGALQVMTQAETLATQGGLYLQDSSGAANDIAFTLPSYITSLSQLAGALIRVKAANTNTGASTVSPIGFSSASLVYPDGNDLLGAQIIQDSILTIVYDPGNDYWFVQSISSAPTPGRNRVTFASGASSYVIPDNVASWTITITGGGGGAGGADASNAGSGGGAGGTAIRAMSFVETGSRGIAYSIGAGGAGGAPGASGAQGAGTVMTCGSVSISAAGGGAGEYDSTPAGGDGGFGAGAGALLIKGGTGTDGSPGSTLYGGNGGASYWGGGGRSSTSYSAQVQDGAAVGSGGGSGYGGASVTGGAGKAGIMVVEWGA